MNHTPAPVEILVNVLANETRVAQLENGVLQEIHIQREGSGSVTGNIYRGRVQRVLPGIQAAFVEIGLERTAFLPLADALPTDTERDDDTEQQFQYSLTAGDELLVQVIKDPMGTKGARVTTKLSLPSRFLVYRPYSTRISISARIYRTEVRERLYHYLNAMCKELGLNGGFIVRTAGRDVPPEALAADMRFLNLQWQQVMQRSQAHPNATLLYSNLPLSTRMLRDMLQPNVVGVRIDDRTVWQTMRHFCQKFAPEFTKRILFDDNQPPLFDRYGIEHGIEHALQPIVPLKSGGFIVIEQTEAMVTVDVNSGGFIGSRNLDDTILRTNLEAARTIAHQLRLRNLGGLIIIDFIDMQLEHDQERVLSCLANALSTDPARIHMGGISAFGLVEMTRKRTRESLLHQLCEPCQSCQGRGVIKTSETVCYELMREMQQLLRFYQSSSLLILAAPSVVDSLTGEMAEAFAHVCKQLNCRPQLQSEPLYNQEQFDLVTL